MTRAAVAAAPLLLSACLANTSVTPIGPRRPSRPEGCPIDVFPSTVPPYPFTPIAKVRTECDPVRRHTCVAQLRSEACRAGADAVIDFKESTVEWTMFIDATFVAKGPPVKECDPICSPGFTCQDGQCMPQCNPACQTGEICSRKRICEPNVGAPVAAPPGTPP